MRQPNARFTLYLRYTVNVGPEAIPIVEAGRRRDCRFTAFQLLLRVVPVHVTLFSTHEYTTTFCSCLGHKKSTLRRIHPHGGMCATPERFMPALTVYRCCRLLARQADVREATSQKDEMRFGVTFTLSCFSNGIAGQGDIYVCIHSTKQSNAL